MPYFIVRSQKPYENPIAPTAIGDEVEPGFVVTQVFQRQAPSGLPGWWHRVRPTWVQLSLSDIQ